MLTAAAALGPAFGIGLSLLAPQTEEPWRGVLDSPGGELPFVMSRILGPYEVYNGPERIRPRTERSPADSIVLSFPPYDSRIEAKWIPYPNGQPDGGLDGTWKKTGPAGETSMAFHWRPWPMVRNEDDPTSARYAPMFPLAGEPSDVQGRWLVRFGDDAEPAVAIFAPLDGRWTRAPGEIGGTFLTVTGDYRYLAGTARGGELRLSCFDGAHAFLFAAKLAEDGSLRGDFWSGSTWHETWVAERDDEAALPDPFTLTTVRPDQKLAELRYPDADGEERRIGDLLGKVTLVQLFGTWCPNCGDAGPFLKELLARYEERGLSVLGLAFEHGHDRARHTAVVREYRAGRGADWPILIAGPSDKAAATAAFPVLDRVRAYPTTLFVDAAGTVRAVHQGFSGPATGDSYAAQQAAFDQVVRRLCDEAGSGR